MFSSHSMLVSLFFWSFQSLKSKRIKCCSSLMHVFSMPAACVLSQKAGCGWLHLAGMVLQLLVGVGSGVTGLPCPNRTDWDTGLPRPSWVAFSRSWTGCVCTSTHTCKLFNFERHRTFKGQWSVFYDKNEAPYTQSLSPVTEFCVHLPVSSLERVLNPLGLVILKQFLTT